MMSIVSCEANDSEKFFPRSTVTALQRTQREGTEPNRSLFSIGTDLAQGSADGNVRRMRIQQEHVIVMLKP